jgi:hypothetical protein
MLRTDIIYYYKHDREILIKYYETWTKSYALFYVSKTNKMTQKTVNSKDRSIRHKMLMFIHNYVT